MAGTPSTDSKFRVKVYELNDEGEWSDKGTGHVQFQLVQSVEAAYLFVHSEADSSLLLESKVIMEGDVYQRQGDTIISWSEPFTQQDLALSFAEASGCEDIWEKLCSVRGVDPATAGKGEEASPPSQSVAIPAIEHGKLKQVLEYLDDLSPFMRESVAATMVEENYVKQLVSEFKVLEAEGNREQLHQLFLIVKGLIAMNELNLLEMMLHDDFYVDVFGILEYDPKLAGNKPNHREFLVNKAKFKPVVPFNDDKLVARIHQNFRVQFLRDVVLPTSMDDATFGTLNSVIFFNGIDIVHHIQEDKAFLRGAFQRLKSTDPDSRKTHEDLLGLLQELVALSKNLQLEARKSFFAALHAEGVMGVFESALSHPDASCRLRAFAVLNVCAGQDASAVRVSMMEEPHGLLRELIQRIVRDPDHGIKGQASDLLKTLLDPESMDQGQEKNQFLTVFYDKFMDHLIAVFNDDVAEELPAADLTICRNHVCELLTFFVQSHGYRVKYFVLRNNIIGKVCALLNGDQKYVALSAVRFVRACIGLKDEFYYRYMIRNDSFRPIVDLFVRNGERYNLLNSAILELFAFICTDNIRSMVAYIAGNFEELRAVKYVDTFTRLWQQHEKNKEAGGEGNADKEKLEEQQAEEDYFEGTNSGNAKKDGDLVMSEASPQPSK